MADIRRPGDQQLGPAPRHRRTSRTAFPTMTGPYRRYRADTPRTPGDSTSDLVEGDLRGLARLMSLATEVVPSRPTIDGASQIARQPQGRLWRVPLALVAILIAQAALSLNLTWSNTAYIDEALYLWAGHLEWAHWLHDITLPSFPTYFSGAPVIYPPLGALADSIGGLAGARALSLCFMLGATTLLWSTTSRLYGRQAAFFGTALWAFLGPTLMLGAYATYDAMSLFLIALAAWCTTTHQTRDDATGWMVAAATALTLANVANYASTIFDPEVIALAVLVTWSHSGSKAALRRGALLATCVFGILYLAIRFSGPAYSTGVSKTILMHATKTDSVSTVLGHAGVWVGAVVALACGGVALSVIRRQGANSALLLTTLSIGALLAPLEYARIHTPTSLNKQADFAAWFAAIAAGYAIDKAAVKLRPLPLRVMAMAAAGAAIATVAIAGFAQAQTLFTSWPNAAGFVSALRPIVAKTKGPLLVETSPLAAYYLPSGSQWKRWSDTYHIQLTSGATTGSSPDNVNSAGNLAAYAEFISRGYFAIIALNSNATPALDHAIEVDLSRTPGYHIIGWSSYNSTVHPIWSYKDAR